MKKEGMCILGKVAKAGVGLSLAMAALPAVQAAEPKISDNLVKVGVLTDMSGPYSDFSGAGAVTAAQMAIEDFQKANPDFKTPIELVSADHQNKVDIGMARANAWFDVDKVDVITELVTSNIALAVSKIAADKNRVALVSGAASLPLTNEQCNKNTVHWVYDTYSLSNGTAKHVLDSGKKNWYFITVNYTFGGAMMDAAGKVIEKNNGKIVGSSRHPLNSTDFSSYLLNAQQSNADVIALANGGQDTITAVKQAAEFGITQSKQSILPMVMFINDIHALGLDAAQGLMLTEGFYWDRDDKTRDWSERYYAKTNKMPSMGQAGVYSSVINYLDAIKQTGTDNADKVMAYLKSKEIDDGLFKGKIREDGKFAHDMLLLEVKKPGESKRPWDYYHIKGVISAEDANLPLSESKCHLVTKR